MKYLIVSLCVALSACGQSEAAKDKKAVEEKVVEKPKGLGALPEEEKEKLRAELAEIAEKNRIKNEALLHARALKYKEGCLERFEAAKAKREYYNKAYRVPEWDASFVPDEFCDDGSYVPYKRGAKK